MKKEFQIKLCYTAILTVEVDAENIEDAMRIVGLEENKPKRWPKFVNIQDDSIKVTGYDDMTESWNKI